MLIEDGQIAAFSPDETTYAAMGRFGNVLLVAGEPELALTAQAGEVVRLYLTNTANTRVFKVALPGARMKLVGGDSGRVEHEQFVEDVILAPSERVVVDVLFDTPGELTLEHRTPDRTYKLADITVSEEPATPPLADAFATLRTAPELTAERERLMPLVDAPPDKTLAFQAEMDMGEPDVGEGEALLYVCPMHPEVTSESPGPLPGVWHEAHRPGGPDRLRVPDASGGDQRDRGPLPAVRHEAPAGATGASRRRRARRGRARRARP